MNDNPSDEDPERFLTEIKKHYRVRCEVLSQIIEERFTKRKEEINSVEKFCEELQKKLDEVTNELELKREMNLVTKLNVEEAKVNIGLLEEEEVVESQITEEYVKEVLKEVVIAEKKQGQRDNELVMYKNTLRGRNWYYKHFLDIYVSVEEDIIIISFSSNLKEEDMWVKLRTDDCKEFEFVDMASASEEMIAEFKESKNIMKFLVKARKYFKGNKADK